MPSGLQVTFCLDQVEGPDADVTVTPGVRCFPGAGENAEKEPEGDAEHVEK